MVVFHNHKVKAYVVVKMLRAAFFAARSVFAFQCLYSLRILTVHGMAEIFFSENPNCQRFLFTIFTHSLVVKYSRDDSSTYRYILDDP